MSQSQSRPSTALERAAVYQARKAVLPSRDGNTLEKVNRAELANLERKAKEELAIVLSGTIDNDEDLQEANAWLLEVNEILKRIETQRKSIVDPLNQAKAAVQAIFTPPARGWGTVRGELIGKIGKYQLACAEAQRQLYQETAAALPELTHEELSEQLAEAAQLAPAALEGTSVKFRWQVKRVNMAMLSDEWKAPKLEELEEYAKRHGDEEPIIPGVIWERVSVVRATGR